MPKTMRMTGQRSRSARAEIAGRWPRSLARDSTPAAMSTSGHTVPHCAKRNAPRLFGGKIAPTATIAQPDIVRRRSASAGS